MTRYLLVALAVVLLGAAAVLVLSASASASPPRVLSTLSGAEEFYATGFGSLLKARCELSFEFAP